MKKQAREAGYDFRRLGGLVLVGALLIGGSFAVRQRSSSTARKPVTPQLGETAPVAAPTPTQTGASQELIRLQAEAASNPQSEEILTELGAEYARLNRDGEALQAFQKAARIDPASARARIGQGQVWMRLNRPLRAVEALEAAVVLLPANAELRLELADAYLRLRDFNRALRNLQKAVELAPDDAENYRAYASGLMMVNSYERAYKAADKAVSLDVIDVRNWTLLGSVCLNSSRYDEAEKRLRHALTLNSQDIAANVLLGKLLLEHRAAPEAKREAQLLLSRALTLDPFHAEALHLLGKYYLENFQPRLAAVTLRRALEAAPTNTKVRLLLGQALVRNGHMDEGRRHVRVAQSTIEKTVDFRGLEFQAARNPNPNVHLRLARLYFEQGAFDSAAYTANRALGKPVSDPVTRRELEAIRRAAAQKENGT